MTSPAQDLLLASFIVFCRISACLMVAPGLSSRSIPMRARLLLALACTYALSPLLIGHILPLIKDAGGVEVARLIVSESLVGLLIGICGRIFFMALEFAGTAITSFLGFSAMPGVPVDDAEQSSSLTSLITMTALVMIFVTNLHIELVKAMLASYRVIEVRFDAIGSDDALRQVTTALSETFELSLRLMSPFLVYSIVANFLFGLANKLLPQIPVYFISGPFIIAGGLGLCLLIMPEFIALFTQVYTRWLVTGSL